MPKIWTLKDCFGSYGASGANQRWSWSARSQDGNTVVITLWKDLVRLENGVARYDSFNLESSGEWIDLLGNRERIENLIWARDNCDGLFRVVITIAEDTQAEPRKIEQCFPQPRMVMRIIELNESTGEFRAESVGTTP